MDAIHASVSTQLVRHTYTNTHLHAHMHTQGLPSSQVADYKSSTSLVTLYMHIP